MNLPYRGCFTFLSTFTVMVLSILLLETTPVLTFLKFLSDIILFFRILYLIVFFLILFSCAPGLSLHRGCSLGSPKGKLNVQILISLIVTHLLRSLSYDPAQSY